MLVISIVHFVKHILFVISSNVIESALITFPSLLLPSSCVILEKHKRICMPGGVWAQSQAGRMSPQCVRSHGSAGCRQVVGTLG